MTPQSSSRPDPAPLPGNAANEQSALRRQLGLGLVLLACTLLIGLSAKGGGLGFLSGSSLLSGSSSGSGAATPIPGIDPNDALAFGAKRLGPVTLTGRLDRGSVLRGNDGTLKMELVIAGEERDAIAIERRATDLLVVLDRSGSMEGEPLANAKGAIRELVSQLSAGDRFGLVSYASGAQIDIPTSTLTSESRDQWTRLIARLGAGGGTNMSSGLDLAEVLIGQQAREMRSTRVILISDGQANQGDASLEGLRERASRAVKGEYVLSTAGVGQGFDENVMAALADAGTGNFYYVPRSDELGEVFRGEFASARQTVASGLSVALHLQPGTRVIDAAGYPLERTGERVVFRPGDLYAGQTRRIWVTLQMPTSELGERELAEVSLDFRADGRSQSLQLADLPKIACVEGEDAFLASIDEDTWAKGVVKEEYNRVRQRVARSVQAGRAPEAKLWIQSYVAKKSAENDHFENEEVGAQLRALGYLAEEMDVLDASSPEDRNAFAKDTLSEALDGRREGGKYAPQQEVSQSPSKETTK